MNKKIKYLLIGAIDSDDRPNAEIIASSDNITKIRDIIKLINHVETGDFDQMDDPKKTKRILKKLTEEYYVDWRSIDDEDDDYVPNIHLSLIIKVESEETIPIRL